MEEFNMDSAKNDIELRNQYLESEKEKVFKIKKAMVSALQKTDSLLKK
jgi:translation elongation factor EF-G